MVAKISAIKIQKGTFLDGRERLYVTFRNGLGNEYEWTPKWKEEIIKLFDEASVATT